MSRKLLIIFTFASVILAACERTEQNGPEGTSEIRKEFSARFAESLGTKASQGIGRSWLGEEHIHVFKGATSLGDYVSADDGERETAVFKSVGSGDVLNATDGDYWAVYPYNPEDKCDGESVIMAVPSIQEAHEKGVFLRSFPAVAHSKDGESFDFYNVCGGVRFTVASEGIESVVFRNWTEFSLAGNIKLSFGEDGLPEVAMSGGGDNKNYVYIKAPSGGFTPGVEYFAAFVPRNLPLGIYAIVKKGEKEGYLQLDDFISSDRSIIVSLEEIDKDLVFGDPILGDDFYAEFSASFDEPFITENGQTINRSWIGEESISVFQYANTIGEYRSQEEGLRETALFSRVAPMDSKIEARAPFWAIYPYNKDNSSSDGFVSFTLPSQQTAAEESDALRSIPAVAKSDGRRFSFSNLCGAIRFSLKNSGINSVTFRSFKGEPISGRVHLRYDDLSVERGPDLDYVTVTAPGEGFIPGKEYVAYFMPQTFIAGMSVVLTKGEKQANLPLDIDSIRKSLITNTFVLDEGYDFDKPGSNPAEIIVFADERMKAQCVAAFDKDGDEELSVGEAAQVTSIADVFTDNQCSSFDEFRYFTSVSEIPAGCFQNWASLKSISFPEGLRLIAGKAFFGCTSLTRINIPSLETWAKIRYDFINDFGYSRQYNFWDGGMPFYSSKDGHLFVDGEELTELDITSSFGQISDFAFFNCTGITRLNIQDAAVKIGIFAFNGCDNLSWVNVPSLTDWFSLCQNGFFSTSVTNGFSVTTTYRPAHLMIAGEEVTNLLVPESVSSIPDNAFSNMESLISVSFSGGVCTIGNSAFRSCTGLRNLSFNNESVSFGDRAFSGCSGIERISFGEGNVAIGNNSFAECEKLKEISFGGGSVSIKRNAFENCNALTRADIPSVKFICSSINLVSEDASPFYSSKEGHLFINGTELTGLVFPETVSSVNKWAFINCTGITDITLRNGVGISYLDVANCSGLRNVHLDKLETWLELQSGSLFQRSWSFGGHLCLGDEEILDFVVPEGIELIGRNAFDYCKYLKSVTIASSVTEMEEDVFSCTQLEKIVMKPETPPSCTASTASLTGFPTLTFRGVQCPILVPAQSVDLYKSTWPGLANLITANPN